jgi:hypothetical protein
VRGNSGTTDGKLARVVFCSRPPKGIVGAGHTGERGWNLTCGQGRAGEIRKLTAAIAFERGEPPIRRPRERTAADRTENDARRRGRETVHGNPPREDNLGSRRHAELSPFAHASSAHRIE